MTLSSATSRFSRRWPALANRGSFSLLEVLLASLILGIVSVMIYASFARSLEIPEYVRDLQGRYQSVRLAMSRILREVGMAYLSKHMNASNEEYPRYLFRVVREGDNSRLDFTSFAHQKVIEDANESDQCEVGYFVEEDRETGFLNLMRREGKRIDHQPGSGGPKEVLCENIVGFEVNIWNDLDKEFVEEWDTSKVEQFQKIPRVLEIVLTVKDEFDKEIRFYTKAKLQLTTPLDFSSL